jgi:hypothetical protein
MSYYEKFYISAEFIYDFSARQKVPEKQGQILPMASL